MDSSERQSTSPQDTAPSTPKPNAVRTEILEWVRLIVIVLAVGLFARTFLFQIIRVDGPSMQDTLFTDEYMFVGRLAYRVGAPEHGDVVICHYPDNKDDFVKRIVGVPGDTIEIRAGVLIRNGAEVAEPYVVHPMNAENMLPVTLGEDEYLVFGDNRANSLDGRVLGPLSKKSIKGRVNAILWPLNKIHIVEHAPEAGT